MRWCAQARASARASALSSARPERPAGCAPRHRPRYAGWGTRAGADGGRGSDALHGLDQEEFERRHRKRIFRARDLLREDAVHRLIGCLRTVWGRHPPTMPLGHRAERWESPPWRLARQCSSFYIHSLTSSFFLIPHSFIHILFLPHTCEQSAVARDYVTSRAVHRRYFTFKRRDGAEQGFSRLTCE